MSLDSLWKIIGDSYNKFIDTSKIDEEFETRVVEVCKGVVGERLSAECCERLSHTIVTLLRFEVSTSSERFNITFEEFTEIVQQVVEFIPFVNKGDSVNLKGVFTNKYIIYSWYNKCIAVPDDTKNEEDVLKEMLREMLGDVLQKK